MGELKAGDVYRRYSFEELFAKDAPLLEVLEHALVNNYDLQQGALRIQTAHAQMQSSLFDFIPGAKLSVAKNISMASGASLYSGQTIRQKSESYQSSLGVDSYEVDIWGKKLNEVASLKHDRQSYESAAAALRLTLMADLANNWYETLYMIKIWHLLNDKIALLDNIADGLQALDQTERLDAVIMSKFIRGRASDENSRQNLQKEIVNRIHKLEYLSGYRSPWLNTSRWQQLSGEFNVPEIPQRITSEVIFNRPDVMASEMKIKSANGAIGIARAAFLPVFNLFANAYHTSNTFNNVLDNLRENWTLTPSLILPVFNWPKNYANLDYAKSQQAMAVVEYRKTVAQALLDIQEATNNLNSYQRLLAAARNEVAKHQQNFAKISHRYAAGYADLYSYYEAIDMLNAAVLELESHRQQTMANTVVLLKAVGG
ncbi:TolC family protein [Kalamiella sp. sgz302252]|uniref:TolC family protein n=1 Tax=Pantoea sp. sgz302252 TaxID=3341827 RepID=UPI0036D32822